MRWGQSGQLRVLTRRPLAREGAERAWGNREVPPREKRRRGFDVGETWSPPRERAKGERRSCALQLFGAGPASFETDEAARLVGRIDDEHERVVERVVLDLPAGVREVDAEVEPPLRERRLLGLEDEGRAAVPAELGGRDRAARDEDARVVAQLPDHARRVDRRVGHDVECDRERLAREELRAIAALGAEQPHALDARDVAAPLAEPGRSFLRVALACEE